MQHQVLCEARDISCCRLCVSKCQHISSPTAVCHSVATGIASTAKESLSSHAVKHGTTLSGLHKA
jgi:hypothetical protein